MLSGGSSPRAKTRARDILSKNSSELPSWRNNLGEERLVTLHLPVINPVKIHQLTFFLVGNTCAIPADRLSGEEDHDEDSILIRGHSATTSSIPGSPPPMTTLPVPSTHYGQEHSSYMNIDVNMQGSHGPTCRPSMYHGSSSDYGHPVLSSGPSDQTHSQAILPLPAHPAGYGTHINVPLGQSQFPASPMEGLPTPGSLLRDGHGHWHAHTHAAYGRDYGH